MLRIIDVQASSRECEKLHDTHRKDTCIIRNAVAVHRLHRHDDAVHDEQTVPRSRLRAVRAAEDEDAAPVATTARKLAKILRTTGQRHVRQRG